MALWRIVYFQPKQWIGGLWRTDLVDGKQGRLLIAKNSQVQSQP